MSVLRVRDLTVTLPGADGTEVRLLDGVGFELGAGEVYGVAGSSGSGKTQLLLALLGLGPRKARVTGSVLLEGRELVGLPPRELERLRGDRIAMVFQDPLSSLNPCLTIGTQLTEVLAYHRGMDGAAARDAAEAMLAAVHITEPRRRLRQYPHELSGGMRQRVCIAMALLCEPAVLLADEPTTALDVTVQAQVVDLLAEIAGRRSTAMIFVTHDLGVLAGIADRVAVMEGGRLVEEGPATQIYAAPSHPATRRLLAAARELSLPGAFEGRPS